MIIIQNNSEIKRQRHICFSVADAGEILRVFEVVERYYAHPGCEEAWISDIEIIPFKEFQKGKREAAAAQLLKWTQENIQ